MSSKEKGLSASLTDDAVNRLFERFSLPLVQPCITPSQKRKAVEIAKMLLAEIRHGNGLGKDCLW